MERRFVCSRLCLSDIVRLKNVTKYRRMDNQPLYLINQLYLSRAYFQLEGTLCACVVVFTFWLSRRVSCTISLF
jgi:hypothetical protein